MLNTARKLRQSSTNHHRAFVVHPCRRNKGQNAGMGPQVSVDKPFLWADGRVNLKASLNKAAYVHGENVTVTLDIKNDSRKIVRKIRNFVPTIKTRNPTNVWPAENHAK
ncbi:hypothetical protein ZHAS_00000734 [Anopheles sinensis]|uniref:Arrestin_C domain-containing protein n=1 Tax=Anopheles sinensis TaxID=74873 RepID=A0A084VAG6_ANOSI|nr:hypothetical protein ZHAS_00000734 [Anopheles sinensis]